MNIVAAFFCVFLFSLTAPFTRLAALSVSPNSIILIRILGAGLICLAFIVKDRWVPPRKAWAGITAAALGSVIGFNSFMAYGLKEVSAGHAAVALAGLPMATSVYSILRDRVNPTIGFWIFSILGSLLSFGFFFFLNVREILFGDFLLLLAVLSAAFGYVEGGRSSRLYGGARTMSWAVIITLPICIPFAFVHFNQTPEVFRPVEVNAWLSLMYLAFVSQSLGMFLWFKVLAVGPMEKIAQVQLLQPFLSLVGAIVILKENVLNVTWVIAGLVAICIIGLNKEKEKLRA